MGESNTRVPRPHRRIHDNGRQSPTRADPTLRPPLGGYEYPVYCVFSLMFLISRSVAVSLLAARVHSAAQGPAAVLYEVPSPVYSVEVQRFLDQVNGDNVALTGLQFFGVTRGLLLNIEPHAPDVVVGLVTTVISSLRCALGYREGFNTFNPN
ncbi:Gustatory receptor for sugar taste 64f [Eumeta japonica]|uniref:Gustatory receptor for sugar taste 64f n=1 Tax=Eumeta variegata TaxID=151549 RepID=A0A4C1UJ27_EUMVA|nr:Gustatory receptor for sugar taste 64f [Eumeta japonica]